MRLGHHDEELDALRHSTSHLMAQAVLELYPGTQLAIGPPIENGFYYDFEFLEAISADDLPKIEKRMQEIAKKKLPIEREDLPRPEAEKLIHNIKQDTYKVPLLEDIAGDEIISFYRQDSFVDLCRGPHVATTGDIKHFKLLNVAGAYWRGSEKNKMLTRIYGTVWPTQEELDNYLHLLEEAKARDHRKLGRELGLFMFSAIAGQGLPLWLPKGAVLRDILERYLREEQRQRGYLPVVTPHIASKSLFMKSGHLQTFTGKMFPFMEDKESDETFILKPMNCPHHIEIYASQLRSYRDLPVRLAEFGTVYRYEQSGELAGLLRVRGFTQDDAHLFVRPDQLLEEFKGVVDLMMAVLDKLNLKDFRVRVGIRDPLDNKYVGSDENWVQAQAAIEQSCQELNMEYEISVGDAAFYGPKLDLMVRDALGREWQMGTVQVDYNLPERFQLEYIAEDGKPHRPVMIHRAPFGSLERMIGLLIEHFAGAFPLWLAPEQVRVSPIADRHVDYAKEVAAKLDKLGYRVSVDDRRETLGKKIREAQNDKIPYMLILGDKDITNNTVSVRKRIEGDLGPIPIEEFADKLKLELATE
ncbi:MAG: threonine--tRNA ligase [bacterium]